MAYLTRRSLSSLPSAPPPEFRKRFGYDDTSSSSEGEEDGDWSTKTDSLVVRQNWTGEKRSKSKGGAGERGKGKKVEKEMKR